MFQHQAFKAGSIDIGDNPMLDMSRVEESAIEDVRYALQIEISASLREDYQPTKLSDGQYTVG